MNFHSHSHCQFFYVRQELQRGLDFIPGKKKECSVKLAKNIIFQIPLPMLYGTSKELFSENIHIVDVWVLQATWYVSKPLNLILQCGISHKQHVNR